MHIQVGCELEFYLLAKAPDREKREDILPLDDSRYCQSSSADAAMEGAACKLDNEVLPGMPSSVVKAYCVIAKQL